MFDAKHNLQDTLDYIMRKCFKELRQILSYIAPSQLYIPCSTEYPDVVFLVLYIAILLTTSK